MKSLLDFIRMGVRPKTLTAAIAPVLVGTSLSKFSLGQLAHPELSLYAGLSAICIQIGTNLFNDAYDFKKGTDNADRLGPTRLAQSGLLRPNQVILLACVTFLAAILLALPLVSAGGIPIVMIGIFSLLAGYLYTAGPYPLAYVGLGDLFVLIFFGFVPISGIYFLHTGNFGFDFKESGVVVAPGVAAVAGLQLGLLATLLIAINNFRDAENDIHSGKMTLAARFGWKFAKTEITVLALLPYFLGIFWWLKGSLWTFLLPCLSLPLAMSIVRGVLSTKPGPKFNGFLGKAALTHLAFGILLSIGFILSS